MISWINYSFIWSMRWRCRRRRPHHCYFFLIDSESNDDQFGILYIASNSMHAKRLIRRQQTGRVERERERKRAQILLVQLTTRYVNCPYWRFTCSSFFFSFCFTCDPLDVCVCGDHFIITPQQDDNWFRLYNWFVITREISLYVPFVTQDW